MKKPLPAPRSATEQDRKVGERIRDRRKALGLTQTALGNKLGISFQQVQKYERGANRVSGGRLIELARILKLSVGALLGLEPESQSDDIYRDILSAKEGLELALLFSKLDKRSRSKLVEYAKDLSRL